ncbi:restriction endonuclease subunit S [Hominicoprocola fusiformis]
MKLNSYISYLCKLDCNRIAWEQRKVSELAEKTYGGGTPSTLNEAYWDGDIPWIQSSDVVDGRLFGVVPRKRITQYGLNNSATQLVPKNSIAIITRVGVGKLAFMPYSYATSQDFLSLSKLNAEPLFTVYACYKKLQSELNAVQGTSIKGITKDELLAKTVMVPQYAEQQQIGAFLSQLDNLITLHQRQPFLHSPPDISLIVQLTPPFYTFSWEQRKLGELVDRVVRKNTNNESTLPLTISAQYGLVDQITYFNNRVASRDVSNYYLVLNGEFAYNKSTSDGYPFGAVKRLDLYEKGVLSTLYIVFSPKKEQQVDSDFLTVFFDTDRWHKGVAERAAEGARNHGLLNISAEDFFDIDLSVPKDVAEQKQIGAFIRQLDNLITLHQRKPFLMKWRTSDANRNQTNRLVL